MLDLLTPVLLSSLAALGFALFLVFNILSHDEGTQEMIRVTQAAREGAGAYLHRQYRVAALFFAGVFILLLVLSLQGYLVIFVPFAFLTGGLFSGRGRRAYPKFFRKPFEKFFSVC